MKKYSKLEIAELYAHIIEGYRDKDEDGNQLDPQVRPLDYLNAVDKLSKMFGHDKPEVETGGFIQSVIKFEL